MSEERSSIVEFYRGRSVLVTGGTGFMGKVLVEKLLRSCPQIGTVYLLVRPKRGHTVQARLQHLLETKLFDWLRLNRKESLKKVVGLYGDLTLASLGLSSEDTAALTENVSVVFHAAATVKFDDPLKMSVAMNLSATKKLLQLCHRMSKLEALVHVSTAYCNCNRREVAERIYEPPGDPEKIIQTVEVLDEALVNTLTPKIIGNRPNTYTFTKALAEHLIMEQCGQLPVAIVRPSIVTASWKEPMPGWVDNLNGATGLIAGAGKGVLRSLLCTRDNIADLIPVDVAINLMITVAWHTANTRPNSPVIYNCTSGSVNPVYWRDVESIGHECIIKYPYSDLLWYPGGSFKSSRLVHKLCVAAFQNAPAYLSDCVAWSIGRKPIMVSVQKKLQRAVKCLEFFTTNEFIFSNENTVALLRELKGTDKVTFSFDVSNLDWKLYLESYVLGTRQYIMKEDPQTIPSAQAHIRRFYWVHRGAQMAFFLALWKLMKSDHLRKFWYYMLMLTVRVYKSAFNSIALRN